jgi:DNA adenine methylase
VAFTRKYETRGQHIKNNIDELKKKMEGVEIFNCDYQEILEKYDTPETIHYLDPPYLNMEKYYEGQKIEPLELAEVCKKLKGKFILSYSDEPEIRDAFQSFHIQERPFIYLTGNSSKQKTELIITNFQI